MDEGREIDGRGVQILAHLLHPGACASSFGVDGLKTRLNGGHLGGQWLQLLIKLLNPFGKGGNLFVIQVCGDLADFAESVDHRAKSPSLERG